MRRTASLLGVVAIAATLLLVVPSPASAAYKPPVDPYPDLPSQQFKTYLPFAEKNADGSTATLGGYEPGSPGWAEKEAIARENLTRQGYAPPSSTSAARVAPTKTETLYYDPAQPTNTTPRKAPSTAAVPRPITAPSPVTRAAAGPLLGGFLAGFAIGQTGLAMYGQISGTDPLADICGSGFEGVGSVIYMGMMPDCTAVVTDPNADTPSSVTLTGAGLSMVFVGNNYYASPTTGRSYCYMMGGSLGAGWTLGAYNVALGSWGVMATGPETFSPSTSGFCYTNYPGSRGFASSPATYGHPPQYRLHNPTTGEAIYETVNVPNPSRTAKCSITWEDGMITEGTGFTFEEESGFPVSADGTGCDYAWKQRPDAGPNMMPRELAVRSDIDGGGSTEVLRQVVPTPDPEERAALSDTTGKGLVLHKGSSSCLAWAADCAGWWDDPEKEANYRCTYGDSAVSLAQCYVYRDTFELDNPTATITDPVTGEPTPWTGNDSLNSTSPDAGPTPGDQCMSEWSSVPNPVEWVFHPVKCAFVWAFVPRDVAVTALQDSTTNSWNNSTPGKLALTIGAVSPTLLSLAGDGCGGLILPALAIGADAQPTVQNTAVLPACPGDFFAPYAPGFYWFATISLGIGGFFAVKRLLDGFVGLR